MNIVVTSDFVDRMVALEMETCRRVAGLDEEQTRALVQQMATSTDGPWSHLAGVLGAYAAPKVLEVGAGYGVGLCGLLARGVDAVGIEPGEVPFSGRYEMARELLRDNRMDPERVQRGIAEEMPFPDASFEIVHSTAVLEHVQDPTRAMDEMARVLKPGGLMVTHVPNYHSFFEGHYRVTVPPPILTNRAALKMFVRYVHGRDASYVDTLNLVSAGWFERWAKERGTAVHVSSVAPVLGRVRRTVVLADHGVDGAGWMGWLGPRPWARRAVGASTAMATRTWLALGLSPEIIVLWWKERAPAAGAPRSRASASPS